MATLQQMSVPAAAGSCLGRAWQVRQASGFRQRMEKCDERGACALGEPGRSFFVRGLLFQRASASFLYETCPALEKAARYGPFCAQTLRSANSLLCACPKKPSLLRGATHQKRQRGGLGGGILFAHIACRAALCPALLCHCPFSNALFKVRSEKEHLWKNVLGLFLRGTQPLSLVLVSLAAGMQQKAIS